MYPRLSIWSDSNIAATASSIEQPVQAKEGTRSKRKRETPTNRVADELEHQEEHQVSQVLNNYFHFPAPAGTVWFQQAQHEFKVV
ncbi:unnamed protein product [Gongylonema pulchrum]|uniref:Uncharacterized protein n=1 Tax=Gongylonema pulchrum TaxID=637853 RepID=A0A183DWD0_9BILA|nr:unnamed protein product [Gongylonema pulchrum]